MHSDVPGPVESCTVRYTGPWSHAQQGTLAWGVMHSDVPGPVESCTVRYTGPWSHAQQGTLAWGVMHSKLYPSI